MSVDTYLQGKRIGDRYRSFHTGGVEILVANTLSSWAQQVTLDVRRFLIWRRVKPIVEHKHLPT